MPLRSARFSTRHVVAFNPRAGRDGNNGDDRAALRFARFSYVDKAYVYTVTRNRN